MWHESPKAYVAGVLGRRNRLFWLAFFSAGVFTLTVVAGLVVLPQGSQARDCTSSIHASLTNKDWASSALFNVRYAEASLDELDRDGHRPEVALAFDNLRVRCGLCGRVDRMCIDGFRAGARLATVLARTPPAA